MLLFLFLLDLIDSREKQKFFDLEVKEKMKLVAVEKRLEAHQKALTLWYELSNVIFPHGDFDKQSKVVNKALKFWYTNCLYLEKNTRYYFREVINIVSFYSQELECYKSITDQKIKGEAYLSIMDNWKTFNDIYFTIQEEVELTPIKPELKFDAEGNKIKNK